MWSSSRLAAAALSVGLATSAFAQTPVPPRQMTFAEAVQQAQEQNATVRAAATTILHAEGLVRAARAATLLQAGAAVTTTTLNTGVEFQGATVTPQNSVTANITADMPIVAAAAWARRTQAQDTREVATLNVGDVRRQIAFAAADAYLTILGLRRVVDADARARDVAKAHYELAAQLERAGSGSRLNALRAQQQWSTFETELESAHLALYRAQEALGILVAADGPIDAGAEPAFDVPPDDARLELFRTDLKLFAAEARASERIVRDSSKDWWPTVDAVFLPSTTYPSPFFLPANSWQFQLRGNIPIFDSGARAALRVQRQADADQARENLAGGRRRAGAEVRSAREAVASSTRGLASARAAADQAQQVVSITNVSFRAGAATNIEVIDAQRSALDAETSVAVAEDALRRARLELLNALGRFP